MTKYHFKYDDGWGVCEQCNQYDNVEYSDESGMSLCQECLNIYEEYAPEEIWDD